MVLLLSCWGELSVNRLVAERPSPHVREAGSGWMPKSRQFRFHRAAVNAENTGRFLIATMWARLSQVCAGNVARFQQLVTIFAELVSVTIYPGAFDEEHNFAATFHFLDH
jgi:hypothetical protein